jgi:hypothetical protein
MLAVEGDLVIVMAAAECRLERLKLNAIGFLRVPMGLFDLTDHCRIHMRLLPLFFYPRRADHTERPKQKSTMQ